MRKMLYFPGSAQLILKYSYRFLLPVCAFSITHFWSLSVISFMCCLQAVMGELKLHMGAPQEAAVKQILFNWC